MKKTGRNIVSALVLGAFLFAAAAPAAAEKPMVAIAGIISNSPRTMKLAYVMENQLLSIIRTTGRFDIVNSTLLKQELKTFRCLEEKCILRFATRAGFNLVVFGEFDDRGDDLFFVLSAYGMDFPYRGRLVYRHRARIPMTKDIGAREYNFISEEHAGRFMAGLFEDYRVPVKIIREGTRVKTEPHFPLQGSYDVYRPGKVVKGPGGEYRKTGSFSFDEKGNISVQGDVAAGDVILVDFRDKAAFLKKFYRGRKREIVLKRTDVEYLLFSMLLAPLGSAAMPVINPVFGYYQDGDWQGLGLWFLNATPWIYLEVNGFMNWPKDLRKEEKDVSRFVKTNHAFAWYMACAGGTSLFVDAFAQRYLRDASNFRGVTRLMGNSFLAGYLALISGGGGHFYRGYRAWGYFYFQLNNLLMYFTMYAFSPPEHFNGTEYEQKKVNKAFAWSMVGTLCAVKIVEVIHALLLDDRLMNGSVKVEKFSFSPHIDFDEAGRTSWGARFSFHY